MRKIIFTDLDGTLLDHDTYSYAEAGEALALVKEQGIPLVICSSKTRAEIEQYRDELNLCHPFISENGGGIFVPEETFSFEFDSARIVDNYRVLELGTRYEMLRRAIEDFRRQGLGIKGFGDMTAEELAKEAGLSVRQARLAKKREYDEAFRLLRGDPNKLVSLIRAKGLNQTRGGRYWHLMGANDKGRAVKILSGLYEKEFGVVVSVGIGDSENDFPMLDNVSRPYLVMRKDGTYAADAYIKIGGIGPKGWNRAVKKELVSVD
jgi:mannosyl-3-phosphoglycerate phosphatase